MHESFKIFVEHGKEKMDCSYGNRQKRRSLSSILRVSEGLEYIVYTAKKKKGKLDFILNIVSMPREIVASVVH
jgi:hypothetical protein